MRRLDTLDKSAPPTAAVRVASTLKNELFREKRLLGEFDPLEGVILHAPKPGLPMAAE